MEDCPNFKPELCPYYSNCEEAGDSELCHAACLVGLNSYYIFQDKTHNFPEGWKNMVYKKIEYGKDEAEYKHLAEIGNNIKDWVLEGNNLYIYSSNVGNGKTTTSVKLGYMAIQKLAVFENLFENKFIAPVVYINVDEFLQAKKDSMRTKDKEADILTKRIKEAKLVIWDDIGTSPLSNYEHTLIYTLINNRIGGGKANIFTSNVIDDDLINNVGKRLANRIQHTSDIVEFINPSFRRPK